ncbi:MAG TPA: M23 family metallopeptidase [Pyrinomonadaceae bacterium]|jgi:murein DD-endopeptidase MepM/ murein hydrolase activator NlpD|nr:M23 family metallopeptidase [Pyrinomonadaceae bacterium]
MSATKLRILLVVVFLVILALVSIAIRSRTTPTLPALNLPPNEPVAVGTPLPPPPPVSPTPSTSNFVGTADLIIPVAGVRPDQLIDTFDAARSEGRVHDAIDIPAAAETPVLAAADGKIQKLFQSERGGTTIYQLSADQKMIFYYAHLSHYADGLAEGDLVHQGQVIAYVGDTGNAGTGNYHLHFSIATVTDPKRYWEGTNINPYPLLQNRAR